jgi:hypothetical protein
MLHATNKIAAKKLYLINVKIHNFVWPKQRNQCFQSTGKYHYRINNLTLVQNKA